MRDRKHMTATLATDDPDRAPASANAFAYTLGDKIGQGSCGHVFFATHRDTGKRVALKIAPDPRNAAMLADEAQTLLLVDCPTIPLVIGLGTLPRSVREPLHDYAGCPYLAVEWAPGEPIEPLRIPPCDRLCVTAAVARDIGRALWHLHEMGIAHGDVKPANIMLERHDSGYRAMLIDFGYAIATDDTSLKGLTPRYAPPEIGSENNQGMSRDLFSLGVCLAEIASAEVAASSNPLERIWNGNLPEPWGSVCQALTASSPTARPLASWVHSCGVRALDDRLGSSAHQTIAHEPVANTEKQSVSTPDSHVNNNLNNAVNSLVKSGAMRVRGAYVRLRWTELQQASKARHVEITPGTSPWAEQTLQIMREARTLVLADTSAASDRASGKDSCAPDAPVIIEPLDPAARQRWLVTLVGLSATSWPMTEQLADLEESVLAEGLQALEHRLNPAMWTYDYVIKGLDKQRLSKHGAKQAAKHVTAACVPALHVETSLDLVDLALYLVQRPTCESVLLQAETLALAGTLPQRHRALLADTLRSAGQLGRAFAALTTASTDDSSTDSPAALTCQSTKQTPEYELQVLRAQLLRRLGKPEQALRLADSLTSSFASIPDDDKAVTPQLRDKLSAIGARVLLDQGQPQQALERVAGRTGPFTAEVRALSYLAMGNTQQALGAVQQGLAVAWDDEQRARLHCVRGMEAHQRGDAQAALLAFEQAKQAAARAGAVVEEATYATGVAAAAVDAGYVQEALQASARAALLWQHLNQPVKTAYAKLDRACAFALVGDDDSARAEANEALNCLFHTLGTTDPKDPKAAQNAREPRLAAFLWMLLADIAPITKQRELMQNVRAALFASQSTTQNQNVPASDLLRLYARELRAEILSDEQVLQGDRMALEADTNVATSSKTEWWTARGNAWLQAKRLGRDEELLGRLLGLIYEPMPVGVLGEALQTARALAEQRGDGQVVRRLASMQSRISQDLLAHVPGWLRAKALQVPWVLDSDGPSDGEAVARARNLEILVKGLTERESLRTLLDRALDALVLWTGVERGLLLLRTPADKLVVRAARNLARCDLQNEQLQLSHTLAERALTTGEPVVAVDAAGEMADMHKSVHALGLRSVVAVPLMVRGEAVGVAYLDDRVRVGAFGPRELQWVRLVASIVAMAIADARAENLLRRQARQAAKSEALAKEQLAHKEADLEHARRALATDRGESVAGYEAIVGQSPALRSMISLVQRVAPSDVSVLIQGESGSGKELVARALHQHSARGDGPFVTENCSAIPEPLFESTLFGHLRGAFTGADRRRIGLFEAADGGTLFLDEVGEIPLQLQSKLLRVLQDGEVHPLGSTKASRVNVRVLAATNRDLRELVQTGKFREDLYYRLNVVTIMVPSLRERAGDIPILVEHFLQKYAPEREIRVSRAAWQKLESYDWPGNIRQLENEVRRALALCDSLIDEPDLTQEVRGHRKTQRISDEGMNLKARVSALERMLISEAMEMTGGNQTRAARILGLSRFGLQKMIKRLEIG